MLRALARGRAVATREPGASGRLSVGAGGAGPRLPRRPGTGEARWLLGQVRLAAGRPEEAMALWSGIPHGHPRWLEARLIADRLREAVEVQRINRDQSATAAKMDQPAGRSGPPSTGRAGGESVALTLRLARLELIPDAGRPPRRPRRLRPGPQAGGRARAAPGGPALPDGGAGRRPAGRPRPRRSPGPRPGPTRPPTSSRPSGSLDRSAGEAESELSRRRLGLIARVLTARLVDHLDQLPAAFRDEARLHHARALLFSGDPAAASKEIADWGGPAGDGDDELLRELADTYLRLDAFILAIDAERFRAGRLRPARSPGSSRGTGWPSPASGRTASRTPGRSSTPPRSSTPTSAAATSGPGSSGCGRSRERTERIDVPRYRPGPGQASWEPDTKGADGRHPGDQSEGEGVGIPRASTSETVDGPGAKPRSDPGVAGRGV